MMFILITLVIEEALQLQLCQHTLACAITANSCLGPVVKILGFSNPASSFLFRAKLRET